MGKRWKVLGSEGSVPLLSARALGADATNKPFPHVTLSHTPQEEKEIIVCPLKEQKHYHSGGRRAA